MNVEGITVCLGLDAMFGFRYWLEDLEDMTWR